MSRATNIINGIVEKRIAPSEATREVNKERTCATCDKKLNPIRAFPHKGKTYCSDHLPKKDKVEKSESLCGELLSQFVERPKANEAFAKKVRTKKSGFISTAQEVEPEKDGYQMLM